MHLLAKILLVAGQFEDGLTRILPTLVEITFLAVYISSIRKCYLAFIDPNSVGAIDNESMKLFSDRTRGLMAFIANGVAAFALTARYIYFLIRYIAWMLG